jgi:SAM-dependent methyltransferase
VRPLAVGGIDFSPLYERIRDREAVILDVGCGTGAAHRYLTAYQTYFGMDTDAVAVEHARRRYGSSKASFTTQVCREEDVRRIAPTHVILAGILHHLKDSQAVELLRSLRQSPRLRQVLSVDIVYLPNHPVSNLLARLDRGRFCRTQQAYRDLVAESGLRIEASDVLRSHPRTGIAKYLYLTLAK